MTIDTGDVTTKERTKLARLQALLPLILAPFIAGLYYLSSISAFSESIKSVLLAATDVDPTSMIRPHWGSHWIYRGFAEALSLLFSTFVTAGIARNYEKRAALIGACALSLWYAVRLAILFWALSTHPAADLFFKEPWYQFVVDGGVVLAAPVLGLWAAELAQEINLGASKGFGGVNRAHFVWLWLPAYWYGLGLITPVMHFYMSSEDSGLITNFLRIFIFGVPAIGLLFPLFYGLALLSNHAGQSSNSLVRNIAGVSVLIVGLFIGGIIEYLWARLMMSIF